MNVNVMKIRVTALGMQEKESIVCKVWIDKSVPLVTVKPSDAKVTLRTDLSILS